MRSVILGLCTVAMAVLSQVVGAAPGDVYLLQVPNITGNVTHQGYVGWISLTAFSAGFTSPLDASTGAAGGRVTCQQVVAIKPLDAISPLLALDVASGRPLTTVYLAVINGEGHEFLRLTLKNAVLSSLLLGGDNARSARSETLSISAQQIELTTNDATSGHNVETMIECRA